MQSNMDYIKVTTSIYDIVRCVDINTLTLVNKQTNKQTNSKQIECCCFDISATNDNIKNNNYNNNNDNDN